MKKSFLFQIVATFATISLLIVIIVLSGFINTLKMSDLLRHSSENIAQLIINSAGSGTSLLTIDKDVSTALSLNDRQVNRQVAENIKAIGEDYSQKRAALEANSADLPHIRKYIEAVNTLMQEASQAGQKMIGLHNEAIQLKAELEDTEKTLNTLWVGFEPEFNRQAAILNSSTDSNGAGSRIERLQKILAAFKAAIDITLAKETPEKIQHAEKSLNRQLHLLERRVKALTTHAPYAAQQVMPFVNIIRQTVSSPEGAVKKHSQLSKIQ